jgi:hypothetical protein
MTEPRGAFGGAMDGLHGGLGVIDLEHEPLVALAAELAGPHIGRVRWAEDESSLINTSFRSRTLRP